MAGNTNYVSNPSPRTNTTGWSAVGGTVGTDSTNAQPGAGGPVIKVTLDGTSQNSAVLATAAGLTVGKRYTSSIFVKIPAAVGQGWSLRGYCATTGGVGTRVDYFPDRWWRVRVSFTATAASMLVGAVIQGIVNNGSVLYADRAAAVDGESAGPYFDGSSPYSSWSGTAWASASTCSIFVDWQPSGSGAPVAVSGLLLNTRAWGVTTRTGRMQIPSARGGHLSLPGQSGKQFIAGKPVDTSIWTASMWVLGALADGTVPPLGSPAETVFQENLSRLIRAAADHTAATVLTAWQPDGTVRQANADLSGATDPDGFMSGARAELALAFEVLDSWRDWVVATVTGTPGVGWSNQTLSLPTLAGGSAPIEDAIFTVSGPIQNPVITTGFGAVSYVGTLANGDLWVVDSGQNTSKVNGVSVLPNTQHTQPRYGTIVPEKYPVLAPSVSLSGTGTGAATNLQVQAARRHYGG